MDVQSLALILLVWSAFVLILTTVEGKKRRKVPRTTTEKPMPTARRRTQSEIEALLKKDGIIPDVISYAPNDTVQVVYGNDTVVDFGNELKLSDVKKEPTYVDWFLHDEYEVYTLLLLGPDSPTRENATYRCFKHWLVGNIPEKRIYGAELYASYTIAPRAYEPGNHLNLSLSILSAEIIAPYTIAPRAYEPGVHRFVFVMYKQPGRYQLEYKGERIFRNIIGGRRVNFNATSLAEKYDLGTPSAVNYFKIITK